MKPTQLLKVSRRVTHSVQAPSGEVKTLVFIGGNIGSGKSTLARRLYQINKKLHVVVKKSDFISDKSEFDLSYFKWWINTSHYTLIIVDTHFAYAPRESVLLREHHIWKPTFIDREWRSEFDQNMIRQLAQDFHVLCAFIDINPVELLQRLRRRANNLRDHLASLQYLEYRSHKERELFMQITKAMSDERPENIILGPLESVEHWLFNTIVKDLPSDDTI